MVLQDDCPCGEHRVSRSGRETSLMHQKVLDGEESEIELQPQNPQIRKMQHELVEQHNLRSDSIGDGTQRRLKIVGGTEFKQDVG